MGKSLRNFLTAVITALGLVILAFSFKTQDVQAANYGSNDMVTSAQINNPTGKDYAYSSTVPLEYHFDSSHLETPLKNGDTLTIQIPEPLTVKTGDTFNVYADDNQTVIGTAVLSTPDSIVITFNEEAEKLESVQGHLDLPSYIGIDKDKAVIGENPVDFPLINGGVHHDSITVRPLSNNHISKKGTLGTDADGNQIVTWSILANRNNLNLSKFTVTDSMTDSNLFMDMDLSTLVVREATWNNKDTGSYSKGNTVGSEVYTVDSHDGAGFTLDFHSPKPNQMYLITFQTKLKTPSQATDGTVFTNKASMEGSYSGNGNGGGLLEGNTSASVSGSNNSGNGSGNKLGAVTLTKKSADNESTLLPNATYSLYKQANGQSTLVQADLTTDANGQINVSGLGVGEYYFVETKAPDGYQNNTNEVPFSITGQTSQAVQVTAEDEPENSKEGSIIIEKIDDQTGWRLPGAEFEVINADNQVVGHITTDQLGYGHLYNLPYGDYILRETKAPDGYLLNDKDIHFTIGDGNTTPAILSVENTKEDGIDGGNNEDFFNASMIKYDADYPQDKIGVPGAEYTLYKSDGTQLSTYTTNEYGVIKAENLEPGDYYFVETKAPDGYDINTTPITFSITNKDIELNDEDPLVTSDPSLVEGEKPGEGDNNGNEGNTSEPGDNNGNENNNGNEDNNNGNEEDNNGGVIVDPENPGSNNNNNSGNQGGIITNPSDTNNGATGSTNSGNTLPQTGDKSGLVASFLGLVLLSSVLYFRRRNA